MGMMVSQITSLTIVYSTIYSGEDQWKHQNSVSLAFVRGIHRGTGEFPAQIASNAENVSIWWRHHEGLVLIMLHSWHFKGHSIEVGMFQIEILRPEMTMESPSTFCAIEGCLLIEVLFILKSTSP